MYSTGYTATGLVVGLIQRLPIFVGALFGLAIMTTWTLNVGPNDGWMGLWLLFEAAPGFLLGGVIGIVFYHVTKRRTGKSLADEDQDAPPE